MASRPALLIDSKIRPIHKRYLGEPSSPHFIPSSPIIERQLLAEEDEEELKRCCMIALRDIQSSDDDVDESIAYLAGHISEGTRPGLGKDGTTSIKQTNPDLIIPPPSDRPGPEAVVGPVTDDTSLLSPTTTTTTDPTYYSTPLISSSVLTNSVALGGETRQLGPGVRLLSPCKAEAQNARAYSQTTLKSVPESERSENASEWVTGHPETRLSQPIEQQRHNPKSTSSSQHSTKRLAKHHSAVRESKRASIMDVDKKLPALPAEQSMTQKPKTHIGRMVKDIRRKKLVGHFRQVEPEDKESDSGATIATPTAAVIHVEGDAHLEMLHRTNGGPAMEYGSARDNSIRPAQQAHQPAELEGLAQVHHHAVESSVEPLKLTLPLKRRIFNKRWGGFTEWKRRKLPTLLSVS